ncbi:MAG: lipoate--protein ligase family protein [Actinobacteria bacterium]|nr:MAG: lipoate--protein ligase family protein [Actinomycetota bacterium]
MQTWRFIQDGPQDGAWNMAVDRAVLASHVAGETPPTLRVYWWRVPTVTLGRFQSVNDVDLMYCTMRGFDVVRRPTGGRGVLHDDEVTYSVVAGTADGLPRGVSASYKLLCGALATAYRSLGVPAALTARAKGDKGAGACYLHATPADLSLGAAKLSGSAQVWEHESVLQHGSFVRSRDVDAEASVFRLGEGGSGRLRAGTATLTDALGVAPGRESVIAAVRDAFESALGIRLEDGPLTDAERRSAEASVDGFRLVS